MRLTVRTSRRMAALGLAASLATACGSTVQVSGTATVGGTGDGLSATAPGSTSGTVGASTPGGTGSALGGGSPAGATSSTSGGALPSSGGGASTGTGSGSPSTGAAGSTGTAPGVRGPVSGRGFTRTTIRLGVATSSDYNSFAGSVGVKGLGYEGDPNLWYSAMADQLNRHGGLLGRKVELVKADYNTAQYLSNPAAANQAACTTWTQDSPVFAVLLVGFIAEDTLLRCLANAQTPLVQVGGALEYPLHYAETYRKFPLFFNVDQMAGDLFDQVAIGRLAARGFFGGWDTRQGKASSTVKATVGLVGFSDHDGALQLASQKQQLASHGVKVGPTVTCSRVLTDKVSCEQSAVLKFASSGVTHVFGADSTFMNNANSQGYYPRYFVPAEPAIFAANVPAKQLVGAMSEGYDPVLDAAPSAYPGDPSPATAACKRIMKQIGQSSSDPLTLWLQLSLCDAFTVTRDAVGKAGVLSPAALRSGVEALGSSSPSALAFNSSFSAGNHASATVLRDLSFRPDLGSFAYDSRTNYGGS